MDQRFALLNGIVESVMVRTSDKMAAKATGTRM